MTTKQIIPLGSPLFSHPTHLDIRQCYCHLFTFANFKVSFTGHINRCRLKVI